MIPSALGIIGLFLKQKNTFVLIPSISRGIRDLLMFSFRLLLILYLFLVFVVDFLNNRNNKPILKQKLMIIGIAV